MTPFLEAHGHDLAQGTLAVRELRSHSALPSLRPPPPGGRTSAPSLPRHEGPGLDSKIFVKCPTGPLLNHIVGATIGARSTTNRDCGHEEVGAQTCLCYCNRMPSAGRKCRTSSSRRTIH